jgi:hypothetical protein
VAIHVDDVCGSQRRWFFNGRIQQIFQNMQRSPDFMKEAPNVHILLETFVESKEEKRFQTQSIDFMQN